MSKVINISKLSEKLNMKNNDTLIINKKIIFKIIDFDEEINKYINFDKPIKKGYYD